MAKKGNKKKNTDSLNISNVSDANNLNMTSSDTTQSEAVNVNQLSDNISLKGGANPISDVQGDLNGYEHIHSPDTSIGHHGHSHSPIATPPKSHSHARENTSLGDYGTLTTSTHGHAGHSDSSSHHGHSHGTPTSKSSYHAHSDSVISIDDEDICSHIRTQTTECGHDECMTDDERKSLDAKRVLILASIACVFFMICELIGGYISNSLAIISDAFHLLSDVLSFLISIIAINYSRRAVGANSSYSYGYHRVEVIGALISIIIIYLLTAVLLYEAVNRMINPEPINAPIMFGIAVLGLLVNVLMGVILMSAGHGHSHGIGGHDHGHSHGSHGHSHGSHSHDDEEDHGHSHSESSGLLTNTDQHAHAHSDEGIISRIFDKFYGGGTDNINVRAAFVHVLGDAIQSVGVMVAAAFIWCFPQYTIADPICTVVFSIIVLFTTSRIVKEGMLVLMEGVPTHLDASEIRDSIKALPGVLTVHDMHVWALSVGKAALSAHVLIDEDVLGYTETLQKIHETLETRFDIKHSTIQIEMQHGGLTCHNPKRNCVKDE